MKIDHALILHITPKAKSEYIDALMLASDRGDFEKYEINTPMRVAHFIAQMAHDLQLPGAVVHYSWPSAAEPLGYAHDRDSALFARDGLEQLMQEITAAGARRIIIVSHSMGSALTM